MSVMTMPFGKHKGKKLEDVPSDYLRWMLENCDRLSPALTEEAEAQLGAREGMGIDRSAKE